MTTTVFEHLRVTSGEHDRFKHFVLAVNLRASLLRGTPVVALCGKRWRPDGDPSRYPMCRSCADIAEYADQD